MRTNHLLPAALAVLASVASARADFPTDPSTLHPAPTAEPTTTASTTTISPEDARVAALQARFKQAQAVEAQGQLQQALQLFQGIIKDAPDAKGSLLQAGIISEHFGDYAGADLYFSKLHALVPDYPEAIESLIQVNQALKHDAKVEIMMGQLRQLWAQRKLDPKRPYFIREHIPFGTGSQIEIKEFFDYHQTPNIAWVAEYLDAQGNLKRRLLVNYDPEVTATMRQDPKLANAEQFLVVDEITDAAGHPTRLDAYQQFLARPEYAKMRMILMEIFAHALKPIDSQAMPVPGSAPSPAAAPAQ
jgi:tetratricopeptide (TPR) repeat protein